MWWRAGRAAGHGLGKAQHGGAETTGRRNASWRLGLGVAKSAWGRWIHGGCRLGQPAVVLYGGPTRDRKGNGEKSSDPA